MRQRFKLEFKINNEIFCIFCELSFCFVFEIFIQQWLFQIANLVNILK